MPSKKTIIVVALIFFVFAGLAGAGQFIYAKRQCSNFWGSPFSVAWGNIAFPDEHAVYWVHTLSASEAGANVGYRITGRFAHARYQSFVSYSEPQGGMTASSKLDRDIVSDRGSVNPYQTGVGRDTEERSYALWWLPEGVHAAPGQESANKLSFKIGTPSQLILRIYAPDEGLDATGGTGLPFVTAYDLKTGKARPCISFFWRDMIRFLFDKNGKQEAVFSNILSLLPPSNPPGEVHFFTPVQEDYSLFQNPHNDYLVTRLDKSREGDDVVVIRFKPPEVPSTYKGGGAFTGNEQVRYWSLCMGGMTTVTSSCLADFEAVAGSDGFIYVLVSDSEEVRESVRGVNIMSWGNHLQPVMIYRNLATNRSLPAPFPGDLQRVPYADEGKDPMDFVAERFIGDYAPVGVACTSKQFLDNHCGVDLSFAP